jgi:hypothetical protein
MPPSSLGFGFCLDQFVHCQSPFHRFVRLHFENLIIHLQFVPNLKLRSSKFLLVFFVSQAGISLRGEVNRLETRLITRGVVVLRLQGSIFQSEAGFMCHYLPKTIVTIYLTEDRESRSHQVVFRDKVYHQVHIYSLV